MKSPCYIDRAIDAIQPASLLFAASALILLGLGSAHLLFTFHGDQLRPRERDLEQRMQQAHPGITRQTTMWKAWIGFNATHSMAAMLFGLVYGYLALRHPAFLQQSVFLLVLGAVFLGALIPLGRRYFFSTPFRGIVLANLCYWGALGLAVL